jgi:hypothetical protein
MLANHFRKNKALFILFALFLILTGIRVFFVIKPGTENHNALIWGAIYQFIAWFGAICGLYLSRLWGGHKSLMGRINLAFALGLIAQAVGQSVSSYYFFMSGEVPYPSLADLGFFGSVLFYIYGVILLGKAAGVRLTLESFVNKIQALLIPVILLSSSYWFFLKNYTSEVGFSLRTFLDFGYPLGQAFYLSLAILIIMLSRKTLGGVMKIPVIYFLIALLMQYFCDFTFLYQANNGTYVAGGIVDFMYFLAYFAMAYSLIQLGAAFEKIKNS